MTSSRPILESAAANGDIVHAVTISALFLAQRAVEAG
jgi:hypothetical protein